MNMSLTDLPPDCLTQVCYYLDVTSVTALASCNRAIRQQLQKTYMNFEEAVPLAVRHHLRWVTEKVTFDQLVVRDPCEALALAWRPVSENHSLPLLAVTTTKDKVHLYDMSAGTLQAEWPVEDSLSLAWSLDGRYLACGSHKNICIWDVYTQTSTRLQGHTQVVVSLAWNRDSSRLISASQDSTVRVWDVVAGTELLGICENTRALRNMAWKDGKIATVANDRMLRVFQLVSGLKGYKVVHTIPHSFGNTVDWSPDGSKIACGGKNHCIYVYDAESGRLLWRTDADGVTYAHEREVRCVTWSPDGKLLASGSADNMVKIWCSKTGKLLASLHGHNGILVQGVAWSPDGKSLASWGRNTYVHVWRPPEHILYPSS